MKGKRIIAALMAVTALAAAGASGCNSSPAPEYEVKIVDAAGYSVERYKDGSKITLDDKTREGFEFLGYYEDGEKVEFPYTVTKDTTLVVEYQYGTLAENLVSALKTYLASETFAKSIGSASTAAAWLPLAYLRYVDGDFYSNSNAAVFKKYINMLDELVEDGEIKDCLWEGSAAQKQGWYGITDYLYTYAIAMNGYREYLYGKGLSDNSYEVYMDAVSEYLEKIDSWLSNNLNEYDILGEKVTQANLYYTGYNQLNSFGYSSYQRLGQEKMARLLECIADATGSDKGHAEFLSEYAKLVPMDEAIKAEAARIAPELAVLNEKYNEYNNQYSELSAQIREEEDETRKEELKAQRTEIGAKRSEINSQRTELKAVQTKLEQDFAAYGTKTVNFMSKFKVLLPVTQVAFGMSVTCYLAVVKANLNLDSDIPYTDASFLSRYEKDEEGNFLKEGGTPNWVGPTGGPVGASLYRDRAEYDVNFEKCKQGYFPFSDGWSQPLDEMVNLDRLGKFYNHDLGTGANVTPQWGLLTGYMHGINMENYEVAEPVEGEPAVYNIISLWRDNLKMDEAGNYVINGNLDMAVAICYLAYINGVEAPTPLGMFDSAGKVIKL